MSGDEDWRQKRAKEVDAQTDALHNLAVAARELHEKPAEGLPAYENIIEKAALVDTSDVEVCEWLKEFQADIHYNAACMASRLGKKPEAIVFFCKALGFGFEDWKLIEEDKDLDGIRDETDFMQGRDLAKVRENQPQHVPLTIQRMIDAELLRGTLTHEGIDPAIDAAARTREVFHHEWVSSPELKGPAVLVIASFPGGDAQLIHDIGAKTLFPLSKIDGKKLIFQDT